MRQLAVYGDDLRAGVLIEKTPGKGYEFAYDEQFLTSGELPISITLPKRNEPYTSETLFPFFTNMLPEGTNRKVICRDNHLDEKDFFGLLVVMAGVDTIGNVGLRRIDNE